MPIYSGLITFKCGKDIPPVYSLGYGAVPWNLHAHLSKHRAVTAIDYIDCLVRP